MKEVFDIKGKKMIMRDSGLYTPVTPTGKYFTILNGSTHVTTYVEVRTNLFCYIFVNINNLSELKKV